MAHGRRHVVGTRHGEPAGGAAGRGNLVEQPRRFGRRAAAPGGQHLDVAGVARDFGDGLEFAARRRAVICRIVAVGGVEHVAVDVRRVEARLEDFPHLGEAHRGHRPAAAGHLEEIALAELPGIRGVRDEDDVEGLVFAPQTRGHPEEKRLGQLAVPLAHARRDIDQEEHRRAQRGLAALVQLPVAQIVVRECGRSGIERAALHRLPQ